MSLQSCRQPIARGKKRRHMDREARPGKHNAEFSGKTVEEALEVAAEALGTSCGGSAV